MLVHSPVAVKAMAGTVEAKAEATGAVDVALEIQAVTLLELRKLRVNPAPAMVALAEGKIAG